MQPPPIRRPRDGGKNEDDEKEKSFIKIEKEIEARLLGQVTVFDAGHGDCNLVDLCQLPPTLNPNPEKSPWRRILIDTGYNEGEGSIGEEVAKVMRTLAVPAPAGTDSKNVEVPPLREMQLTHFDNDHIGNAATILKSLKDSMLDSQKNNPTYDCELVMNPVLAAWPDFSVRFAGARRNPSKSDEVLAKFYITIPQKWVKRLAEVNFAADFVVNQGDEDLPTETVDDMWYIEAKLAQEKIDQNLGSDKDSPSEDSQPKESLALEIRPHVSCEGDLALKDDMLRDAENSFKAGFELNDLVPHVVEALRASNDSKVHGEKYEKCKKLKNEPPEQLITQKKEDLYNGELALLVQTVEDFEKAARPDGPAIIRQVKPTIGRRTNTQSLIQQIVSPHPCIQKQLVQSMLSGIYQMTDLSDVDEQLENRASVVNIFARKDLNCNLPKGETFDGKSTKGPVRMLFAGDAYDQPCDIQRSMDSWNINTNDEQAEEDVKYFNVIKIPHHGSDESANSGFYQNFRAEVYLICGSDHAQKSGNPTFSSLKAIVSGFEGKARGSGLPFRIYLSDQFAEKDYPWPQKEDKLLKDSQGRQSAIARILRSPDYSPDKTHKRVYEVYRLKPRPDNRVSWGSILFYMDESGNLMDRPGDGWEMISPQ